jgi:Zn-dependent protease
VLFLEPNETAWDLRWRMFGIPVRVHPMFWLMTLVLGSRSLDLGLSYLLAWVGCVFVSILIHELGHVLMGMAFGARGKIVLYSFGGLAIGSNQLDRRWQRIAVSFAGPYAGFLLLAAVFAFLWIRDAEAFPTYLDIAKTDLGIPPAEDLMLRVQMLIAQRGPLEFVIVNNFIFINLMWGLLNLLPVWPLDGGQISREVCTGVSPQGGLTTSLGISLVMAGLLAFGTVLAMQGKRVLPIGGSWYTALLFGLLAFQSLQLLMQAHAEARERAEWTEGHWDRHD